MDKISLKNECKFMKSLDVLKNAWGEQMAEAKNLEEKVEIHLRAIVAILGIFVEHELDKCEHQDHDE